MLVKLMFIEVNDINYHVKVVGKGAPLLLLHGFTGSLNTWSPFITKWGQSFKLILVDIIGHGKTDHPADYSRYSIEYVASDLKELLNKLEITKTHILGYSMGGRIALSFSLLFPERVQTLLLESSSPGLHSVEECEARKKNDNVLADKIEQDGIEAFVDYWEKVPLFATQEMVLTIDKRTALREERLQNNTVGLANSLRGMGTGVQPSWWGQLAKFNVPVFLVVGELDKKFCSINQQMNQIFPNSEILIVNDAGHAIHVEQPEFFGKIIMDYLKDKLFK